VAATPNAIAAALHRRQDPRDADPDVGGSWIPLITTFQDWPS